ncbi:lipopolysaccharide assembly protein LapA domain-containing protein [Lentibacillus sp. L22]|uniref:LapA family protein n=1 Tax=Lentibacillus TaxID=175304 RepID=UPI0022B10C82|nr:lipopolysaccharide assembly protein LapA domain-containing protein [Lentibacillus daqui]
MRGQTYVILAIVVVIIVAIFAVTNVDTVEVNYLFWSGSAPLILVILFSVLMGGIITAAVGAIRLFRLQREARSLKAENREMKQLLQKHGLADKLRHQYDKQQSANSNKDNPNNSTR